MKKARECRRCGTFFDPNKSQCPSCLFWHVDGNLVPSGDNDGTVLLTQVEGNSVGRIKTNMCWDANFGGDVVDGNLVGLGIACGSTALIAGKAGAGKSTAALQLVDVIAAAARREGLIVAVEESAAQVKDRAIRLKLNAPELVRIYPIGTKTDLGSVIRMRKPSVIVIDSLPGVTSDQDEAIKLAKGLKELAVELNVPVLIIDHINKQDDYAGKEALQHEVDTTLMFIKTGEGEYRELTTDKNRFGVANVTTRLLMTKTGLVDVYEEEVEDDDHGED